MLEATPIWTARAVLGEGPLWSKRLGRVFFVDIRGSRILSCDLAGEAQTEWGMEHRPCWIIETSHTDRFLVGLERSIVVARLIPGEPAEILHRLPDELPEGMRLNDAKAGPDGQVYFGSMDDAEAEASGHFLILAGDGRISRLDQGYTVTNGPAVSPDGRTLYHTDSPARTIYAFDRSQDASLTGKRVFIRFTEADGYPDGMTCDAEGGLWVCHWDGGRVTRFLADGTRDRAIALPVSRVTSCAFAGPGLDQLVITTAAYQRDAEPLAGALFVVTPGIQGLAAHPAAFTG
ncbi:SMP-30/gluconolactonase/LRE family protein [Acidisoma cellulosilytica]|uniref:SMP-30/gluconolactonase/LRE family protein n=1 Tax=Acidisoma cellulosilyticum TaxID=2802395 RepID=A0A964E259_9PROT|nr:SMP-30/gluconolactonase/LRE family protein [Acidisoma cellulosilyticum]